MSAQLAHAAEPDFDDGDGRPTLSWATVALGLAGVLHRVRERGPYFAAAVDAAVADLEKGN